MTSFFLAPALVQLRDEINVRFPKRDKRSDGWIGDPSHAARPSDHNPDWDAPGRLEGVVRATDTDIDDNDPGRDLRRQILNATIGDPRVWYVISNQVIYSRTHGWRALRYTGSNGHFAHVHVSLRHGVGEFDTSPWLDPAKRPVQAKPVDLSVVQEQFRRAAGLVPGKPIWSNSVARIQRHLGLDGDGFVGPKTLAAWAKFERDNLVGIPRAKIPDAVSLPAFAKGRFRIQN